MKHIKVWKTFESTQFVENICKEYGIRNWTLNEDGSIDVDGNVDIYGKRLKDMPIKFGRVTGWFNCGYNKLTNLEGCPNWVGDNFSCSDNQLTNLIGGPNFVDGDFYCEGNQLTSLEGCPENIFGDLYCKYNSIKSLEFYPTILTGQFMTVVNPIDDVWATVRSNKSKNHGLYLELFWLNNPIRYENGEWVCYREFLDNFYKEIGVPSPHKLTYYKEI